MRHQNKTSQRTTKNKTSAQKKLKVEPCQLVVMH